MSPVTPLLLLLALSFSTSLFAQLPGENLTDYGSKVRMEKIYVAHDKPHYLPGETIWTKVWLVDAATHLPYDGTPVVYLDWIKPDGSLAQSFTLRIDEGTAEVDITTSRKDTTGGYTLRAYSRYQRNFDPAYLFQKEILLLDQQVAERNADSTDSTGNISLRFFPEGGHLVSGLETTVGFKATDGYGKSMSVRCALLDPEGKVLSELQTLHDGMGIFRHRPMGAPPASVRVLHQGTEYSFPLPEALPEGMSLSCSSRARDYHRVSVVASPMINLAGTTLVGHCRGQVFLNQALPGDQKFSLRLPKAELPSGLLHLTLFDDNDRPVAERLVFNTNPTDTLQPVIVPDQTAYSRRDSGNITLLPISGPDSLGAQLSLSVYHADDPENGLAELNIMSYLLLQSDLRGNINDLPSYFTSEDARTSTLRDLLLLTHGWRKFDWLDVLSGQYPTLDYAAEQHLSVAGRVTKEGRDKPVQADVQFNVFSPAYFTTLDMTTAADGIFFFTGFDFQDTVDVILQASTHNPRRKNRLGDEASGRTGNRFVDLELFELNELAFQPGLTFPATIYRPQALKRYAFTVANELAETQPDVSFSVDLDEVVVSSGLNRAQIQENEFKQRYEEKGVFYFGGTPKFQADDPQFDGFKKDNIFELISLIIPTVFLVRNGGAPSLRLGSPINGTRPYLVLDGKLITPAEANNINPDDIAVIDLMEGLFSKIYTDSGTVIQLISKDPIEIDRSPPGIKTLTLPGFYQAKTFYAPGLTEAAADYRTTLYWNPDVKLGPTGITLPFTTGDKPGRYVILAEGLREDGVPFVRSANFRVN